MSLRFVVITREERPPPRESDRGRPPFPKREGEKDQHPPHHQRKKERGRERNTTRPRGSPPTETGSKEEVKEIHQPPREKKREREATFDKKERGGPPPPPQGEREIATHKETKRGRERERARGHPAK